MVAGDAVELDVDAAVPRAVGGAAMKERVDRDFSGAGKGAGGGRPSRWFSAGRGRVYERSDQEATGGPEASVRAQV